MLSKPVNGAWRQCDSVNKVVNGAWQECEAVCKPKNGAWQEVWSKIKLLSLKNETVENCKVTSPTEFGGYTEMYAMNEDGYVIYTAKGDFNNPSFNFEYKGYCSYLGNASVLYNAVGSMYLYGIKADGSAEETLILEDINFTDTTIERGYYAKFSGGDYTEVGFKFVWKSWDFSITDGVTYYFAIRDILIDGNEYITDISDDFEQGTV
jgi:hypothetical protein